MDTHISIAANLLRGGPPVIVNEDGYPVDWPYAEGMADFICLQVGLPRDTVQPYIMRLLHMHSHNKIATMIPVDEQVMVCLGTGCENTASLYIEGIGTLCRDHLDWTPPRAVCTCKEDSALRGAHHAVDCSMFMPSAEQVQTYLDEVGAGEEESDPPG